MIPLRDINPTRRFPIVTVVIIGLNVAMFLVELLFEASGQLDQFIYAYALIPVELTQGVDLPPSSLRPAFLTIFTSMFMHGGFLHIIGNMLFLWIFGNNVEDNMGPARFLVFYLACGIAASLAQVVVHPSSDVPNVGASGAIAGVLGAYLMMYPQAQVETLLFLGYFIRVVRLPAVIVLGFWIVIQVLQGLLSLGMMQTGGVAWFAHVGGFIAGLVLVNLFRRRQPQPMWRI
jgi:membrane associated rhomboid family serine protease